MPLIRMLSLLKHCRAIRMGWHWYCLYCLVVPDTQPYLRSHKLSITSSHSSWDAPGLPKADKSKQRKTCNGVLYTHYKHSSAFPRHSIYSCRASGAVGSTLAYTHYSLTSSLPKSGGINCASGMMAVIWGIDLEHQ